MNTALLLIDMQNDYFKNGTMELAGSENAVQNARQILDYFRNNNMPVIYIQHIALRPTATFFLPNTAGAEIHESVKPVDGEKVITKHFPNSFIRTDLQECLISLDIKELVICGMMTHMCVDATVRAAKDLGYNITLIGDACATRDQVSGNITVKARDVHHSFLAALSYYYSTVKSTWEYIEG